MVRILTGESWKLNPSYLSSLKLVTGRVPRLSTTAVLDVLGIEVDGVNVTQGLSEAAIFEAVDELAAIVLRLCRDPGGGGQLSLADGAVELVLGRRGAKASLCVVSLSRPARILAGELEVDLPALAQATASCAHQLLADLADINDALARSAFARRLARRAELLRKTARLSGRVRVRKSGPAPLAPEPYLPSPPDAPSLGFALFDEEGRIDAYHKGGELYSLLGPGEVFLRDARGVPLTVVKTPPFLVLTDLARAAGDLMASHQGREPAWEGALASGGSRLRLDLPAALLTVEGRAVPCQALQLARALLQAALDFGGAIVARNPGQSKNPYLAALVDGARERLAHLRELEGGELFAEGAGPRTASHGGSGAALTTNTLKRLRFRIAWRGVDTGSRALSVRLADGVLVALAERRVSSLDAATGSVLAARRADGAVLGASGVLLSDRARLVGLSWRGEPRFLRDLPGHDQPLLVSSVGTVTAGVASQEATVCLLEGCRLAAIFSASGRTAWHFHAPQAQRLCAAAAGSRIYAAADNGLLYALEASQGQVLFRVRAGCVFEGGLALGAGLLASLGRQEGALWVAVVDAASGRPRLSRPVALSAAGTPLPFRRRVVLGGVADGESVVVGFALTGKEAFRVSLGAACGVPTIVAQGGQLFASLRDGTVACIGPDGQLVWKAPRCGLELDHALAPVVRKGVLLAAGDPIRALDPKTGALLCELPPTQGLSALTVGRRLDVYAVDDDGVAACYHLATHLSVVG